MNSKQKSSRCETKKGFSLLEVIIAMAIFAMMVIAFSAAFSSSFVSYRNSRAMEKDLEEAQYGMNSIAKTLRTSTFAGCWSPDSGQNGRQGYQMSGRPMLGACNSDYNTQWIRVYDYSQGLCIDYRFNKSDNDYNNFNSNLNGIVQEASMGETPQQCGVGNSGAYGDINLLSAPNNLTGSQEYVTGGFHMACSDLGNKVVGRTTILFDVCMGNNSGCSPKSNDHAKMQTSVSLRDYSVSGVE